METSSQFHDSVRFTHTQLRDTAPELGSKETSVKAWGSLLNNNGKLNIQFNQFSQINSQSIRQSFQFICYISCLLIPGVNTPLYSFPSGVKFYTKPGSGQYRYLQQGTPDSCASLWIALYSYLSYCECPTLNNRISQTKFCTLYKQTQLRIQILFQVEHLEQNILLYGKGQHSELGKDNRILP